MGRKETIPLQTLWYMYDIYSYVSKPQLQTKKQRNTCGEAVT